MLRSIWDAGLFSKWNLDARSMCAFQAAKGRSGTIYLRTLQINRVLVRYAEEEEDKIGVGTQVSHLVRCLSDYLVYNEINLL